jgi:formylglycine-generating enzyme required for sulfatase activity
MQKLVLSPRLRMAAAAILVSSLAAPASAVSIDWVYVGDPGNAASSSANCVVANCGVVSYEYLISKYEVTNSQYAEFLNAKAASDPLGLYNTSMASSGGITRSGVSGSFSYSAIAGRGDMPVNFVSFYDSLRFANWLHNGQGSGDTETGAYTLLGGTATPSNGTTIARNPGATISLTSENEWFKAAYYDAISTSYFGYPAGSNTAITCSTPTATPNSANCGGVVGDVTDVGSYPGSPSPNGSFDQGGNVREWSDDVLEATTHRISRGGPFGQPALRTSAIFINTVDAAAEGSSDGIRLASPVPEPGTGLLVMTGALALAGWRRARQRRFPR